MSNDKEPEINNEHCVSVLVHWSVDGRSGKWEYMPILNYKCRAWSETHRSNTGRRQSAEMSWHKHPIAHSMVVLHKAKLRDKKTAVGWYKMISGGFHKT